MKFAHYNEAAAVAGRALILGLYNDEFHAQIPQPSIELTDEQHRQYLSAPHAWRVDIVGKSIVAYIAPPVALADYQTIMYKKVRTDIYAFITDEAQSDFPEWKQANYASRLAELADTVAHGGVLTQPEADERLAILSVITWKNTLLAERDRVKTAINAAADNAAVDAVVATINLAAPPFTL